MLLASLLMIRMEQVRVPHGIAYNASTNLACYHERGGVIPKGRDRPGQRWDHILTYNSVERFHLDATRSVRYVRDQANHLAPKPNHQGSAVAWVRIKPGCYPHSNPLLSLWHL